MYQDLLMHLVRNCIKEWIEKIFNKYPLLVEFSVNSKQAILKNFTSEVHYESELLRIFLICSIEKPFLIELIKKNHSYLSIEPLLGWESQDLYVKIFNKSISPLNYKFLKELNELFGGFKIENIFTFRSETIQKPLTGLLNFFFSYKVNRIGYFDIYLVAGPKTLLNHNIQTSTLLSEKRTDLGS